MPTITRFEEIEAWQTARELTKMVYSITEDGKISRDFGLKDQLRRASVSVMSNFAPFFKLPKRLHANFHGLSLSWKPIYSLGL